MFRERLLPAFRCAWICLIVVGSSDVAKAQTVVDPRYVEFTRSADHSAVQSNGTPIVQRYSLSIYQAGSSSTFDTMDLGKPTPDGNGTIRVDFRPLQHTALTPGVMYQARVTAVGPGGSAASAVSNTFYIQGACSSSISPLSQSAAATGATGSVAVSLTTGCPWSAVANVAWITVTGGASGSGNGTAAYSVAANATAAVRTGTLTIAGKTFTVTQAAGTCSYTLSPTSRSMAGAAATGTVTVGTAAGCAWTARSNAAWITTTSSGNGPGTASFSVLVHAGASPRTGTISIGPQTFTVTQSNQPLPNSPAGLRILTQ